jgi:hypothetical protein
MTPDEIKHFLVVFDPDSGDVEVRSFDTDYEAAQAAYADAEKENGLAAKLDIVLLSADSQETIEQTHSSYFEHGRTQLQEL